MLLWLLVDEASKILQKQKEQQLGIIAASASSTAASYAASSGNGGSGSLSGILYAILFILSGNIISMSPIGALL